MSIISAEPIIYSDHFEDLLSKESQKCASMSILHLMAFEKYNKLSMVTNIPVIILSALVGFMSPIDLFPEQSIFLGALSVLIGIIKTLDSYMDFTKRTQSHYMISLSYKKIAKLIQIQMELDRDYRISAMDLLSVITNDIENIVNSEPVIPPDIVAKFNAKYGLDPATKPPFVIGKLSDIKIIRPDQPQTCDIEVQAAIEVEEQRNLSPAPSKRKAFK